MIGILISGFAVGFLFGKLFYVITGSKLLGWIVGILLFILAPIVYLTC